MNTRDHLAKILKFIRPNTRAGAAPRNTRDGLERVTAPELEISAYELMLENQTDLPSDHFDRWRNRMPQG